MAVEEERRDDSIEINHRAEKSIFTITASTKFHDLLRDAAYYWDLPENECVMISKDPNDIEVINQRPPHKRNQPMSYRGIPPHPCTLIRNIR